MQAGSDAGDSGPGRAMSAVVHRVFAFIAIIVVQARLATTVADPDLWGHVRFGQDILRTGSIIQDDPYSYVTGGRPWINHEWLSEVVFAWLYGATGSSGLIAFKFAIGALILGYSYHYLYRQGLDLVRAGMMLLLVVLPMLTGLGTLRPQIFTYVGLLMLLICMREAEEGHIGMLWWLPPLFALWVNLHGGFLAGVAVLGVWVLVSLVRPPKWGARGAADVRRTLVMVLMGSGLVLFLNPYGGRLLAFLLRTATVPRPEIHEWTPLRIVSNEGVAYLVLLAIATTGLVFSRRPKGAGVVLVFYFLAVLPLISMRHLPLFALAVIALGGGHVADVWSRWGGEDRTIGRGPEWVVVLNGIAVPFVLLVSPGSFGCIRLDPDSFAFPARGIAVLRESGVGGNLAIPFDWGEYAIWHLSPRIRVSIDGRRETVYPDATYREQLRFASGVGDWDGFLEKTDTSMVLVDRKSAVYNLMRLRPGWSLVYEDPVCGLFLPRDSPLRSALEGTRPPEISADGGGLCFP